MTSTLCVGRHWATAERGSENVTEGGLRYLTVKSPKSDIPQPPPSLQILHSSRLFPGAFEQIPEAMLDFYSNFTFQEP